MQALRRPPTKPRKRLAYDHEQLRREDEAFQLSTDHGFDDDTVGAKMGVSGRQARTYISRARSRKVEALRRAMGVEGGYQIYASLAYAAAEARSAWEASKEPEVRAETVLGKEEQDTPRADRTKLVVIKKGPNSAYLSSYIQANLAMANLLGLGPSELQRSVDTAFDAEAEDEYEDLRSLTPQELFAKYRRLVGTG